MSFWRCLSNCNNIEKSSQYVRFNYPCSDSLSCEAIEIYLSKGIYEVELYGASGGGNESIHDSLKPGYGGKVSGVLLLESTQKFYLYIGGEGESDTNEAKGGWNGGGDGAGGPSKKCIFGGGGGGTDIRTSTEIDDRIIIAGGGGGCGCDLEGYQYDTHGGNGGGVNGEDGGYGVGEKRKGCGGTQSKGGNGGQWISTKIAEKGELFYGGAAISYGGSDGGGGGGSSFIGSLTNGTSVSGVNKGNGYIVIFSRSNNFCTYTQNSQILITYSLVYYMIINSQ